MQYRNSEAGIALMSVIFMLAFLLSMFGAYVVISQTELKLVKASKDSQSGFNAAEAGLNLRAEEVRGIFTDYDTPEGTSPENGIDDCDAGNNGTGDYVCRQYSFSNNHSAMTYIEEEPGNPLQRTVPTGEAFAGLSALEYRYTVTSVGRNTAESNEAILDLTFIARWIPLFQFAIFFEEDLEFFNGATMTVDGPVHTNNDMYIGTQTDGTTNFTGQVTVVDNLYRGQKAVSSCSGYEGTARVSDTPNRISPNYITMAACSGSRHEITDVSDWNDNLQLNVPYLEVPSPEDMDAFSDGEYWQRADLRLALRLLATGLVDTSNSPTGVEVVDTDGNNVSAATNALHTCTGAVNVGGTNYAVGSRDDSYAGNNKLRLYREYQYNSSINDFQVTLEVDLINLLNCIHNNPGLIDNVGLDDESEEGLVFHLAIDGPLADASQNNYSIRIRNASELQASIGGAATVAGLTLVSDQGMVIWGDFNSTGTWTPAALMADTLWLLSNDWVDADSLVTDRYDRDGNATTVRAGVISGIRRTGGVTGEAGQDGGADSNGGGAINIFRFNEWFRNGGSCCPDFTYVGSLVSLGAPRKSQSTWGPFTYYSAPNRVWSFEQQFNDADLLPPMTPAAIYLRQELFVRDYILQ